MVVVKRKTEWEEIEREIILLFIILLGSLYYFIRLYVKIKTRTMGVLLDGFVK